METVDIVVSAGGGAGRDLIRASLQAASRVAVDRRWLLITGPNLPEQDFVALDKGCNRQCRPCSVSARISVFAEGCGTVDLAGRL